MTIEHIIRVNGQTRTIKANHNQAIIHLEDGSTIYLKKGNLSWIGNMVYRSAKGKFSSVPAILGR